MVALTSENIISFSRAAKLISQKLPDRRGGRALSTSTVYRWAKCGLKGIKLETVQVGGTAATSVEAIERFFSRLAGDAVTTPTATAASKSRRVDAAKRELKAAGLNV